MIFLNVSNLKKMNPFNLWNLDTTVRRISVLDNPRWRRLKIEKPPPSWIAEQTETLGTKGLALVAWHEGPGRKVHFKKNGQGCRGTFAVLFLQKVPKICAWS